MSFANVRTRKYINTSRWCFNTRASYHNSFCRKQDLDLIFQKYYSMNIASENKCNTLSELLFFQHTSFYLCNYNCSVLCIHSSRRGCCIPQVFCVIIRSLGIHFIYFIYFVHVYIRSYTTKITFRAFFLKFMWMQK